VFLKGAVPRRRTRKCSRLAEIVRFAELEHFIDAPLRTYSTGMVARLAFAVATDLQPEILLTDEVLSVGATIEFQQSASRAWASSSRRCDAGARVALARVRPRAVPAGGLARSVVADGPAADVVRAFVEHATPGQPQSAATG
jgi:hypothetical protein